MKNVNDRMDLKLGTFNKTCGNCIEFSTKRSEDLAIDLEQKYVGVAMKGSGLQNPETAVR